MKAGDRQGVVERHPDFNHLCRRLPPTASPSHLRGVSFFRYDFKMVHFEKVWSCLLSLGL
jgi:hypothetical protein